MKTVLSIGTHPDDIEIGCGGTEILLRNKGYSIVHVIATLGEQGSLTTSKSVLQSKRQREAEQSAKIIGVSKIIFLGFHDGLTSFTTEMKIQLIKIIREIRPEIIFTHTQFDLFPDHQVIRSLTQSALSASMGPWYSVAGSHPHAPSKVFGYEVWNPISKHQCSFDISSTIDKKMEALRCHYSQTADVDYLSAVRGLAQFRGVMTMKGKYAEVFEVIHSEMEL